jgi:rRNA processing protein Gar1
LGKRNAAYQTILKKMEINSALRGAQLQKIKKITELVVQSIDKGLHQESRFLATLLGDYTEKLPGVVGNITLENVIADLRLLVSEKPYYENAIVQVKESIIGTVSGSTSEIYFAVKCLLTLLEQSKYSQEIYIYIVTKEDGDKAALSVSLFIADSTGAYQKDLAQCSYKVIEEVFREIMDVKFVTLHKSDKRILQLEFVVDKV